MNSKPTGDDEEPRRVNFTWQVSLGNILSVATVLITATVFVVRVQSTSQIEMAELKGEMKLYSEKLQQLNRDFSEWKTSQQSANAELRTTLGTVSTAVNDMRVAIAGQAKGAK